MGRAFRSAGDLDRATIALIVIGTILLFIILIYSLHQRWHWIRGQWIFLQKYFAGRASATFRKSRSYRVVLEPPYGRDRTLHTITEDLSPTGMFVRVNPPLKKGEIFRFMLSLPNGDRIQATAEVKWAQNRWSKHHSSGNGCRFLELSESDREKIRLSLQRKAD